jgi:hypothetical protein
MDRTRWSSIVHTPGSVEIQWHQQSEVQPQGTERAGMAPVPATRLFVRSLGFTEPLTTVDVTSSATKAMLEGFLASGIHVGHALSWRSYGGGKLRRDTVSFRPLRRGE